MDQPDAIPDDVPGEWTPEEAFSVLGNETRMAILWALWERHDPDHETDDEPMSFTDLRKAVGLSDSGQFSYHLEQLDGQFVEESDDGYRIAAPGRAVIRAVIKGTLTDTTAIQDELISIACPHCGAPIEIDYESETLYASCTDCEGSYGGSDRREGLITALSLPPVALLNRTPEEVFVETLSWNGHRHLTMMRGTCPECAGTVTATPDVCEDHDAGDGEVCDRCGSVHPVQVLHVCSVCKFSARLGMWLHVLTNPKVHAFYADHDYDVLGSDYFRLGWDTITRQDVVATDPLEMELDIEVGGDRLTVRLDETGTVTSLS